MKQSKAYSLSMLLSPVVLAAVNFGISHSFTIWSITALY